MFFIKFKPPQSTGERYWNVVEGWLGFLTLLTPIVLKVTGVITWSWWWVALSPIWISVATLVLLSPWWVKLAARRARQEASEAEPDDTEPDDTGSDDAGSHDTGVKPG